MWKSTLSKASASLFFITVFSTSAFVQEPHLSITPVITGLSTPVQITNAGDGSNRLFVVLQGASNTGYVLAYSSTFVKLDTFLHVTNISTGGERGLLSIAFHPEYGNAASPFFGMFYVYYTNSNGDLQIARYKVSGDPNVADPTSKDTVITIAHPVNANHNGGTIRFGPDGYLYLGTGDGGSGDDPPNNAQNPGVLLGKLLRLNVTSSGTPPFYTIPPDNPFVGVTTPDTLDEIYSLGLRNPFRYSFDRGTGDLWIGDVGQSAFEEIDHRPHDSTSGVNYGWRCYEGNAPHITSGCAPASNYVFPIFTYPNPGTSTAVTGGVVYRGTNPINSALVGYYLATDYYSGTFYKIKPDGAGGWTVYSQLNLRTGVPSIGEGENGEIYLVSQFASNVLSLSVDAVLPARLISFTARSLENKVQLKWSTSFEENLSKFEIEVSQDGQSFTNAGSVNASNSANGAEYSFIHPRTFRGRLYYRLKMVNIDNSSEYSATVAVEKTLPENDFVRPSTISSGLLTVYLDDGYDAFELVSMKGEIVARRNVLGRTGRMDIPVTGLASGLYIARLSNKLSVRQQKVIIR